MIHSSVFFLAKVFPENANEVGEQLAELGFKIILVESPSDIVSAESWLFSRNLQGTTSWDGETPSSKLFVKHHVAEKRVRRFADVKKAHDQFKKTLARFGCSTVKVSNHFVEAMAQARISTAYLPWKEVVVRDPQKFFANPEDVSKWIAKYV